MSNQDKITRYRNGVYALKARTDACTLKNIGEQLNLHQERIRRILLCLHRDLVLGHVKHYVSFTSIKNLYNYAEICRLRGKQPFNNCPAADWQIVYAKLSIKCLSMQMALKKENSAKKDYRYE